MYSVVVDWKISAINENLQIVDAGRLPCLGGVECVPLHIIVTIKKEAWVSKEGGLEGKIEKLKYLKIISQDGIYLSIR